MISKVMERIVALLANLVRLFIASNFWLSAWFDRLLPKRFRVDGHQSFRNEVVWNQVRPGIWIYDVGGGKHPLIDPEKKYAFGLRVTGLDSDASELAQAPTGCYEDICCCDITEYCGRGNADLVICQATLEHVRDNTKAMTAIASIVRPGGAVAIFAPSRHAVYAR